MAAVLPRAAGLACDKDTAAFHLPGTSASIGGRDLAIIAGPWSRGPWTIECSIGSGERAFAFAGRLAGARPKASLFQSRRWNMPEGLCHRRA